MFRSFTNHNPVFSGFVAVKVDMDLRDEKLLFYLQVSNTFNAFYQLTRLIGFCSQHIQIITKDFECDLGAYAGGDMLNLV